MKTDEQPPAVPDYSEFQPKPQATDVYGELQVAVGALIKAQGDVARLEAQLKAAQARERNLSEHELPEILGRMRQTEARLTDGTKVTMTRRVHASMPTDPDKLAAALKELEEKWQHGSIIKRAFNIKFGRDDEKWAKRFERDLAKRKNPLDVSVKRWVEPSTLTKFLRDRLEEDPGKIDIKVFGGYIRQVVEVDIPRSQVVEPPVEDRPPPAEPPTGGRRGKR